MNKQKEKMTHYQFSRIMQISWFKHRILSNKDTDQVDFDRITCSNSTITRTIGTLAHDENNNK